MRNLLRGLILAMVLTTRMWAQNTVAGTVTDAASGRPIAGAIARMSVGDASRSTRTDEAGRFIFTNVGAGRLTLSVRNLGFEPFSQAITVVPDLPLVSVRLNRIAVLDTVRVRAAKQGLYGVVATSGLKPLPNAELMIVGVGGGRIPLDSTAHFFVPIKTVGAYFLRAKAKGYEAQTISVTVNPNDGVEVAFLLDSALEGQSVRLEMAMKDFDERIKRRGLSSALVPRTELLEHTGVTAMALRYARSFGAKALRIGPSACVYLDGVPRPGLSINAVQPEEVEAIETYGPRADKSQTLSRGWPPNAPCGDTGQPRIGAGDDVVQWIVVWLKH